MPKSSKKTPARKAAGWLAQQSPQTDFTLAEFADATPSATTTGRMKKSATKRWDKNVTELCVKSRDIGGNEELAWYEKELSDFDSEETTEYRSDEESETGYGRKVRKKKAKMVERFTGGTDYPYDLWCLIGDYIEPQCVAKFAVICKTSYTVVNTARFWSKLYQRHYVEDCGLPEELKPRYMEKAHGLRTRVIRSLFYFYTPLVARVHNINPFDDEPDILLGSRCVLMWYRKFKGYWKFYFKFQRWQPKITSETQHSDDTHNRLRRFEPQVDHNPEQNFTVLQVTTLHYVRLPMIMGQQLVKTSISVGHGMRYHKIKMIFSPLNLLNSCSAGQSQLSTSITSVIDQVASVRVLPWWDPKYPYNSSMQNSQ